MKKLIYTVVSLVVVGGLLATALVKHHNQVQAKAAQTQNLTAQLNSVKSEASLLEVTLQNTQAKVTAVSKQAAADKAAICSYISLHTRVLLPAQCNSAQ